MTNSVGGVAAALVILAREEAGLSQRALAERAGVSQSEVARIESGRREPSIPTLQRVLAGAGVELRFRLEPVDRHDRILQEREGHRLPAESEAAARRHERNLELFALNAIRE